jgi:uncharacterized repeat protein (TIGR03803 family)
MNFALFPFDRRRRSQNARGPRTRRIIHHANISGSRIFGTAQPFQIVILAVVLAATMTAQAQTFSVLYNFGTKSGTPANPSNPGIIAQGRDGNMYSTSVNGGSNGLGSVFKITPAGKVTVIWSFDEAHGYNPNGGLTLGTDGNFYGATLYGGSAGFGAVFRITPSGKLTVLYNFTGGSDGLYPAAPPIEGTDGNWYGTTQGDFSSYGTLYKLTPSGKLTVLYTFIGSQGSEQPRAPLIQGTDGNFYGTTALGGANNEGIVFKITPSGKLTVLYNFDSTHGTTPYSPLIQGADGNFYGTTSSGGSGGGGVVFKLTPRGKLTVLNNLGSGSGPSVPYAGLVQATDGYFYGTTYQGGTTGDGSVFRMSAKGQLSDLYNFDLTTGFRPEATLLQHTNGILYGDTYEGGTSIPACGNSGCGVFFSWDDSGLKAFVSLLFASGKVGKTVEILGQGFKGTTGVSFNGTVAAFTVVSDTYLTAVVPTGATTGAVNVTTPGGRLTSNKPFRVTPVVLSFSPTSGKDGTPVTITGNSLTQTKAVSFGGVKVTSFTVKSDTRVVATVPTGAKTGHIGITATGA